MNDRKFNASFYYEAIEIQRIGNRAVNLAQEESRQLGVPNVYCFQGPLYYELPKGELSLRDPYIKRT